MLPPSQKQFRTCAHGKLGLAKPHFAFLKNGRVSKRMGMSSGAILIISSPRFCQSKTVFGCRDTDPSFERWMTTRKEFHAILPARESQAFSATSAKRKPNGKRQSHRDEIERVAAHCMPGPRGWNLCGPAAVPAVCWQPTLRTD
jgi:hypothetical protein